MPLVSSDKVAGLWHMRRAADERLAYRSVVRSGCVGLLRQNYIASLAPRVYGGTVLFICAVSLFQIMISQTNP
jgi:hypothetical protein